MFELFKIGFLSVTLLDVIDIALVSFIIYKLYVAIHGTIAAQIFLGLIIVLVLSFIAQAIDLKTLGWLLALVRDAWVFAFIILFQPEIRRLLQSLGKSPLFRPLLKIEDKTVADIITEAVFELAQKQYGALIVIVKSSGLAGIAATGDIINAKVTKNLLTTIFFPRSSLHDGAVIIKGDVLEAAGCQLPMTGNPVYAGETLGMRHRAGLGVSEEADVISIIVSEETGGISVAEDGHLKRGLSKEALRNILTSAMNVSKEKGIKSIFEAFGKHK